MIDVIAFDADDTLWHTQTFYREVEQKFLAQMAAYGVDAQQTMQVLQRLEVDNLPYFGYGIRGFILSMIDAAIQVTDRQVRAADIDAIVEMGRGMMNHEIRLLDGVKETLARLDGRRLMLITKGDTLDQEGKLHRSGLEEYFPSVEVVTDKTKPVYAQLLARHAIDPRRFLMVGNSLRADIAPVLALGGYGVYVPYPENWAHESDADMPADRSRFFEIPNLFGFVDLVEKIERDGNS